MSIEYTISECVTIWQKYNPLELSAPTDFNSFSRSDFADYMAAKLFGVPMRIRIKDTWYNVLTSSYAVRSASPVDGKYHLLYIQINARTNEYYIGKVNRKRWSEIRRYQGSGLKYRNKYNGHEAEYIRYYFDAFPTARECEAAEARIVDEQLLKDPFCLNLVAGGGGTNEHYDFTKRSAAQRQKMKEHPEYSKSMIETAREYYLSGDTPQLRQRSAAIKDTMNNDYYRVMTSERIRRWRRENPEAYQIARQNNREAVRHPETIAKRNETRRKWREDHPEEHRTQQERLSQLRNTPEAREKRSKSLKAWAEENPEEAKANAKKRSAASVAKCSKPVNMCDLETGEVIKTFTSQHEAAQWLVDNGLAKNTNCVSSINAVCQRKPCTTGYGYRKKAYGYDWQYAEKEPETSN